MLRNPMFQWRVMLLILITAFIVSPLVMGILESRPTTQLLISAAISLTFMIIGWYLISWILSIRISTVYGIAIWFLPMAALAVCTLIFKLCDSGEPFMLYIGMSFLKIKYPITQGCI